MKTITEEEYKAALEIVKKWNLRQRIEHLDWLENSKITLHEDSPVTIKRCYDSIPDDIDARILHEFKKGDGNHLTGRRLMNPLSAGKIYTVGQFKNFMKQKDSDLLKWRNVGKKTIVTYRRLDERLEII